MNDLKALRKDVIENGLSEVWTVWDIHDLIAEKGLTEVSDDVAADILLQAFSDHDAEIGICWDSLEYAYHTVMDNHKSGDTL